MSSGCQRRLGAWQPEGPESQDPTSTFGSIHGGQVTRELFSESLPESVLEEIRYINKQCLPLGRAQFKAQVEAKLRIKLGTGKVGRPKDAT